MRRVWNHLDKYRESPAGFESKPGDRWGVFFLQREEGNIRIIATDGNYKATGLGPEFAWEHVSVSLANRCPTWEEMDFVKDLFWSPDECVMQLHVPKSDHKNYHKFCLHLWKPLLAEIPRPPSGAVA
jgi:hypothetical protein